MIRDGFRPASRWTGIALAAALAAAAATAPLKAAQPGAAFAAANGAHPHPPAVAPVVSGGKPLQRWIRYPAVPAKLSAEAMLGKQIFFDPSLSASGKMSCASCHSPDHAYGPPNGLAVQLGGPDLHRPGTRTVPSLRYLTFTPLFTRHFYNPASEDTQDEGPTGGFMRDGSMASLHEQAARPMLDPNEMANTDPSAVVAKLARGPYADTFRQVFGAEIFANPKQAFDRIGNALEAFETEDESFHPYTSKFDAVMSGHADFTAQELRGYALFNDPNKGNCAKCHIDTPGPGGRPAQFADFSYASLGVPRNPEVPATHDPKYFDLGLCGPYRRDLTNETDFCGLFKSPTLRNAAARSVFFHNGRFHTLEDVMHFYVERDIAPQKWYPKRADGRIDQYDDLPPAYRDNIDHVDAPFDRGAGSKPALNEAEIRDVIAFMKTLNDGYSATAGGPKVAAR